MDFNKQKEAGGFRYLQKGEGMPIIILHGFMGGLGNFEGFISHFPKLGYQVFMPELPIYTASLLDTNVKYFAKFINNFIKYLMISFEYFLLYSVASSQEFKTL